MRGRHKGKYFSFILILLLSLTTLATPIPVVEASPGYPILEDITPTTYAGESTHPIDYPATVDPGDLLIAVFGCDDDESGVTFPNEGSEWYEIYFEDGGPQGPTLAVAWKEAVGNEDGGTFDIVTLTSEGSCTYVFRFSGMEDPDTQAPEVSSTASGGSVNPNSLSLSPTGGSKEYLWISAEGNDDDDDTTGYPANMGDNNQFSQVATFTLGIATVISETDAFDPAQFTIAATESWEAVTIAVHPVGIPNDAPTNDQCSITDLDDTDDFYAQISGNYTIDYDVTDLQGFADIDYAEVRFKQGAATRAIFRYDEDTDTFSIESGDTEWELDVTSSSASESGNYINMTFKVSAEWDAIEEADLEIECYVIDDQPESDLDTMQTDYFDVITNLITSSIEFTDANDPDRVDVSSSVTCDFSVRYAIEPGSSTASIFYPPDAEFTSISVYDEADATLGTDSSIVNGDGQITETAKSTVETENYNLYLNMADADYTDGEETPTEQLITDKQQLQSLGANNTSPLEGEWVEIYATAQSVYDGHVLGSGDSLSIKDTATNLYPMTYNGTHWLNETKEDAAVARTINTWDSVSEVTYDITILDMNSLSVVITWGAANNPPVNDQASITNMDDSDNLYAQYTTYSIDYDGHDDDGYIDIDYVLVNLTQASTVRASFKYVNSTNTFSQIDGSTGYTIQIGSCSASRAGNNMNLTIVFTVKWGATEEADLELKAFIIDDEPQSDTDTLQSDYADAVTDLLVSGFTCDDDRGDLSQTLTLSGTVYYADDPASGSPTTFYPPDAEFTSIDIHKASHAEVGSDSGILNGAFSDSFTGEATVDITTYHAYIDMVDADYSDADENPTDTFISDQIKVYWEQLNDTRVNVDSYIEGRYKAVLDWDESLLGSGDSLSSSWGALTWDGGNLWFEIAHTESTVIGVTVSGWSGSEVTYSITSITENMTEITWVYDRIQIQTLGANNTSPALDEVVEIYATAQSEHDSHVLGSGDELTLLDFDSNQYSMTYNGTHWIGTRSESLYVIKTVNDYYNVTEDTYSMTVLDMNSLSVTITWGTPDTGINIGSPVMWRADHLTLTTKIELSKPSLTEIILNKYYLDVAVTLSLEQNYGPEQINLVMIMRDVNRSNCKLEDAFYLDVGEEITSTYSIPVKFANGLGSTQKTQPDYELDVTAFRLGGEPLNIYYAEIPIPVIYGKLRMIPILLVVVFIIYEIAAYILSPE